MAVFGTVLFGIALTDAQHYLIPDGFTVFGLVWLLATSLVVPWSAKRVAVRRAVWKQWWGRALGRAQSRSSGGSVKWLSSAKQWASVT
ncbi:MAG: hypothetical protein U0163_19800 [Gemmatimonadaceae bacterium]